MHMSWIEVDLIPGAGYLYGIKRVGFNRAILSEVSVNLEQDPLLIADIVGHRITLLIGH
jgi:hypothetical protein